MTVLEALKLINEEYKVDILVDGHRVCSYLTDLIPNERRIVRRIKVAYESGAIKMLIKPIDEPHTLFRKACLKMEDFSEIQPHAAEETLAYFFDVLGWKYRIEKVQQSNKDNVESQGDVNKALSEKDMFDMFKRFMSTQTNPKDTEIDTLSTVFHGTKVDITNQQKIVNSPVVEKWYDDKPFVLIDTGPKNIEVIQVIRRFTDLNLTDAKYFIDNLPQSFKTKNILGDIPAFKKSLAKAGATFK